MRLPPARRVRTVVGVAIAATLVHMTFVSWAVYRTRTPVEDKLALADRVMYYAMDAEKGPQFALSGKERALRLVTHVILGNGGYDPRQQIVYGVRLRVRAPTGKEFLTRDFYVTSRVSKAGLDGRLWRNENAFAVSGDELITDARSIKIDLPDDLPLNAILDARLLGGPARGIVKLYQMDPLGETAQETALSARQPASLALDAARVTAAPLDTIPHVERLAIVARDQKRVPAGGERDREYSVRQVFTTPFREDVAGLIADAGLDVDRSHAAAVTVRGPASLTLSAWRSPLDPQPTRADAESASLSLRAIPAAAPHATPLAWTLPLPSGPAVETHPVSIPAGLHTLEITTESEATVRVRVTAPADERIAGFATPSFSRPEGQVVMPDAETVHALIASPDGPALDLDTATRELHATAFRLEAWVPLKGDAVVSSASIFAEAFDAKGQRASREEIFVGAPRSTFDRALLSSGAESAVTEPANLRLVVPPGTRRLRLWASKDVALRVYAQRPRVAEDERIDSPWDEPLLDGTVWRYVPRRGSSWALLEPRNAGALLEAGKHLGVSGSVRIAPGEPLPAPTPVEPIAETDKQRLVDRERADRVSDIIADWGAGLFTGLPAERDVAVDVGRRSSLAEIEYLASPADSGRRAEVFVDGHTAGSFAIDGANGTWRLPHIAPGVHSLRIASSAHARFFVDQPPARSPNLLASASALPVATPAPPPVWRLHTVHKLAPGAPLTLRVDKVGATAETIDVVVYAPGSVPSVQPRLRVSVDRGAPSGSRETTFGLPAPDLATAATIPSLDDRNAGFGRIIPVTLGSEVAPGPHTLELANLSGDVWWARASIAPNGPPDPAAHLDKGDAVAFTVEGPANVVVRVARENALPATTDAPAGSLTVRDVAARLVSSTHSSTIDLDARTRTAAHAVFVPSGVHSLLVTSDVPDRLRVELTAPSRTGIPFGGRAPLAVPEGDAIAPDVRRSQAFVAGGGGTSLVYDVGGQPSTAMRVDAWAIASSNAGASFLGGTLFARFEDGNGNTLHDDSLWISSPVSRFDVAVLADGRTGKVADPVTFRVVRPADARRMILFAGTNVAVKVYAEPTTPPTMDLLASPWRDVTLLGTQWHNAPHESRSWFPLLPVNQRTLIDRGRWASLVTQVRLEPKAEPVPAAILEPVVETEQQSALEPVPSDRAARAIEGWEPGAKAALPLRSPSAFDVGRAGPGRAEITYSAPNTDLGRKVDLAVDGRIVATWLLGTARGSWAVPPLEKGRHVFEAQTAAKGLQLYIDQAPLYDGATVFKGRTVHALLSRPLTFKVQKYTRTPVTLGLVVYAPKIAPNSRAGLRVRIDHGAPRVYALPTADIPTSTRLASLQGRDAGFPRLYPIILGGDLAPGPHTVDVDSVQSTPIWVRAFVADPAAPAQEKARQSFLLEPVNASGPSDE